jgi:hypothetical protein
MRTVRTRLPWLVTLAALYEAYAVETARVPTISQLVRGARSHFHPACPTCGAPLIKARPKYRGWHTATPS